MRRARVRTILALALGVATLAGAGVGLAAVGVSLTGAGPQPETVTIPWGETVVFGNQSGLPQVIEIPRDTYTSETIPPGDTLEYVFDGRAGAYIIRQVGTQVRQGRVVVEVEGAVTLSANETVPYGKRVVLRGTSTVPGAPPVSIVQSMPDDPGVWQEIATAEVAEDGTFSTRVALEAGGRFRAEAAAGQVRSVPVRVDVRPTVTMRVADRSVSVGSLVRVTAKIVPNGATRRALLEIYDAETKRWQRVDSGRVSASGTVALVHRPEERGRSRVRVAIQRSALAPGFASSASRWVTVTVT